MNGSSNITAVEQPFDAIAAALREAELLGTRSQADRDADSTAAVPQFGPAEPFLASADCFPGYQIIREVRRGGQGIVFQAVRESTGADVAIKVLHDRSIARPRELERFEREAAILRDLNHPHLIAVEEIGVAAGRPYLVMPYICGWPIDEHVRRNGLSIRETLALFAKVCEAVNAAHLNGVIHRDLKPSNIRVDDSGGPHVLDFGLAKSVASPPGQTLTETGQFIGSLPWASPEQAAGDSRQIDIRTDVYSLGVNCYQLLTGRFPYDVTGPMRDVLNRIVTAEPIRPRAALVAAGVPAGRIDDELETIILKCLSKEPARRYQSASELAADVRHYLAGQPIEAKRDSGWYVLRKTLRRHRAAVATAAAFVILLTSGTVVSTVFWQRAEQRLAEAQAAQGREREQRALAEEQRELAEKREKETQQVSEFQAAMLREIDVEAMGRGIKERLREQVRAAMERQYVGEFPNRRPRTPEEIEAELAAFDELTGAAQAVDVARQVMAEFVLVRAADAVEEQFTNQPLVRAQLHFAIGRTYQTLGLYGAAEPHLRTALEIRRRHYGPENAHPQVADCLYNLAGLMDDLGRLGEAETLYRDALAMWRELSCGADVATTLEGLAGTLVKQRRLTEAETLLDEAMRLNRGVFGEDNNCVVSNLGNLAVLLTNQGRPAEAEALNRQVLEWRLEHFGDRHPKVAVVRFNLAQAVASQGRHAEAEELFRRALATTSAVYGDDHRLVAKVLFYLGVAIADQGRPEEAESYCRQALAQQRKLLGDNHPDVRRTLGTLFRLRRTAGDHDAADALLREILAISERLYPDGNPEAWRRFLDMYQLGGALASHAKVLVDTDRQRALALFEEAEPLLMNCFNGMKFESSPKGGALSKRQVIEQMVRVFEFWHNVAPDRGWSDRAAEWRAKLQEEAQDQLEPEAPGGGSEEPSP